MKPEESKPEPLKHFALPIHEALAWKRGLYIGEEWHSLYLLEEETPSWRYDLRATLNKWTKFTAAGDVIVIGKPHAVISPEERNEDGCEPPAERWELQFFPEDYQIVRPKNEGMATHRIQPKEPEEFALYERAFADVWNEINQERPFIGNGLGQLQDMMINTCENPKRPPPKEIQADIFGSYVTQRERFIVADLIQWLGSNVGRGFLHEVNKRTGGKLKACI